MLPSHNVLPPSASIYINPKFRMAHINPNFLKKNSTQLSHKATNIYINPKFKNAHINPNFLNKNVTNTPSTLIDVQQMPEEPTLPVVPNLNVAPLITKTKQKLVRQVVATENLGKSDIRRTPILIKIGKRKLIRAPSNTSAKLTKVAVRSVTETKLPKSIRTKYKIIKGTSSVNCYKIDRRTLLNKESLHGTKSTAVLKHARSGITGMLSSMKVIVTDRKLLRIGNSNRKYSAIDATKYKHNLSTKKLELLNINGVLYKSTKTKLQKHCRPPSAESAKTSSSALCRQPNGTKTLFVRGEKFVLNANGNRLTRIQAFSTSPMKRIDIGGLTYVMAKSGDTYERTNMHQTRVHLNTAKQKSIHLLSRNLVKSNVPCPIYRKLGKCHGFERGRCVKLHDARHVAICPKFLRGSCSADDNCLLSHNISLSKMPTCKFYLQGICLKSDCPYLHKKINEKVEICPDFVKGFCELAEKCDRRHDYSGGSEVKSFQSSDKQYIRVNKNSTGNCKNTTNSARTQRKKLAVAPLESTSTEPSRYFLDDTQDMGMDGKLNVCEKEKVKFDEEKCPGTKRIIEENVQLEIVKDGVRKRPKLGTLPSFIPFD